MVEALALPTYALLGCSAVVSAFLIIVTNFAISGTVFALLSIWTLLAFAGMLLRRVGHDRQAAAVEATGLVYGQGFFFVVALFPLSALSAPFADAALNNIDRALGFDWIAYAKAATPYIHELHAAYASFEWEPLFVIGALCWTSQFERLWQFVFASTAALAADVVIFPFVPARGALQFYHFTLPGRHSRPFGDVIQLLKDGDRTISIDHFTGFISMPSYHAASAALLTWAVWRLPIRWLMLAINLAMIAAAPLLGGHYAVDILGGVVVAICMITAAKLLVRAEN